MGNQPPPHQPYSTSKPQPPSPSKWPLCTTSLRLSHPPSPSARSTTTPSPSPSSAPSSVTPTARPRPPTPRRSSSRARRLLPPLPHGVPPSSAPVSSLTLSVPS